MCPVHNQPGRFSSKLFAAWVLTVISLFFPPAQAEDSASASPGRNAGLFDGLDFKVSIVRDDGGENDQISDRLSFSEGVFSSEVCRQYNFVDAPYWVRSQGDQIFFLAELNSPTDGTMIWMGTIDGDTLDGTMRWIKKRWYWTIDTEHRILGRLDRPESTAPAQ